MKIQQLRALTDQELREKLPVFQKELFDLREQARLGKIEKSSRIGQTRKEIARIYTLLRERAVETPHAKKP